MFSNSGSEMNNLAEIKKALSSINWTPPEKDSYSENFVIEAFLKGKEFGEKQNEKILTDKFFSNLELAGKATQELVDRLSEVDISIIDIRLNPSDITTFSVIAMVDEKDYIKEDFAKVYSIGRDIKKNHVSPTFYITFSFMPFTSLLNEACLTSDGYSWKYAKDTRKIRSRQA